MSDNLPLNIQSEIFNRLPVKLLLRLRSVSKAWKSFINDSEFIAHYTGQQHLLVKYNDPLNYKPKYVSYVDNDDDNVTFPQQKASLAVPLLVKMLKYPNIIGGARGLLCLYGDHQQGWNDHLSGSGRAVVWNPSIRKAVDVFVPNMADNEIYGSVLGFGVCRETMDPKIVKITYISSWDFINIESISCIPWQVEVFALSTGVWRCSYSSNLPRKTVRFKWLKVVVDGCVYWLANERVKREDYNLIISFDMTSEEFGEVNLPDSLAHVDHVLYISKLRNSLVVLDRDVDFSKLVFRVWMMEDGDSKSLSKLFLIDVNIPDALVKGFRWFTGFRKTGEPIIEIVEDRFGGTGALSVYEPYSEQINNLGIDGIRSSFSMYPYMETLLLLDQPNFII